MAITWASKAPGSVYRYTWLPDLADCDSIGSATLTVSAGDATIDSYEQDGSGVVAFVSGGTAGTVTTIAAEAITSDGETLTDTIYLPIQTSASALGYTVRDVCEFALRKVVGNGVDADAIELDDAVERLSDMLASWAGRGADIGVPLPLTASDTLYISDAFVSAVKNNLILQIADLYDYQPSPVVIENARRGVQQVKTALLPRDREGADYY